MADHRTRVLKFLATNPGRDDDEIARALQIHPRQAINAVCRKLHKDGLIRRELGRLGKLVNYIVSHEPKK